jgi:hypothetical protein
MKAIVKHKISFILKCPPPPPSPLDEELTAAVSERLASI